MIKQYFGNDIVFSIYYLDLSTLGGEGYVTVSGIVHAIVITSDNVIDLSKTGVWGLEGRKLDKNKYEDNHGKDVARKRQGKLIGKMIRSRSMMLSLKTIPLGPCQTMNMKISKKISNKIIEDFTMVRIQWNVFDLILSNNKKVSVSKSFFKGWSFSYLIFYSDVSQPQLSVYLQFYFQFFFIIFKSIIFLVI